MDEIWKPIDGWPYEVSDNGRVRRSASSGHSTYIGRALKPFLDRYGYPYVSLRRTRSPKVHERKSVPIHRLVALTFLGSPPVGYEVHHIDENRANPRLNNLRYVTRSENNRLSSLVGRVNIPRGTEHWSTHITEEDVRQIRQARESGEKLRVIGEAFGLTESAIWCIVKRKCWGHVD